MASQMLPSGASQKEPLPTLAPDEVSDLADRGAPLEAGELLALFSPGSPAEPLAPSPSLAALQSPGVADVATLLERWVRRVAVGGDQRRGVARLDIGAGRFAGSELVVTVEAGRVSVDLSVTDALDPSLAERLRGRLERRGYSAEVVVR